MGATARWTTGKSPGRIAQCGFTIYELALTTIIAGTLLTGAWIAFGDMRVQWKVANADRMMDQYAHAAMQEMTNLFSWCWGAQAIQGGPRSTRWKFVMNDRIEEHGSMNLWEARHYNLPPGGYLELTFAPTRGILFNGFPPRWAQDRNVNQYLWSGSSPRLFSTNAFDRRDRMTMEALTLEMSTYPDFPISYSDSSAAIARRNVVKIKMVMHYRYTAPNWGRRGTRIFADRYVRERSYESMVYMRNWDVESNSFRDIVQGRTGM